MCGRLLWWLLTHRGRRLLESTSWSAPTVAELAAMGAILIALAFLGGHVSGHDTPPRLTGERVLLAVIESMRRD